MASVWHTFPEAFTQRTSHFSLHSSHSTLHAFTHSKLLQKNVFTPRSFLVCNDNPRATPVQCNVKQALSTHFTLHSSYTKLETSSTSSQLISSELFSSHFMSSHMSAKFFLAISNFHVIWAQLNISHLSAASHNSSRLFCTSESLRHRCIYTEESLQNTLHYKACTKHVPVLLCTTKLAQNASQYYFVLQSLHKALPSTTLYYKACTKHFPVLLCTTKLARATSQYYCCTTKLAQITSQHYLVLQSLSQGLLPSTTVYYKACKSTSQCNFALQSLHSKHFPHSTNVYYKSLHSFPSTSTKHVPLLALQSCTKHSQYYFVLKACTNYCPVPLCTTKLAKVLPSATLYYKACTKHFPVLLGYYEACANYFSVLIFSYSLHKLFLSTSTKHVPVLVLQSLHKTSQYSSARQKACRKHFPVLLLHSLQEYFTKLLCTTKLAQSTFPVLLCTTKLAQNASQYYCVLHSLQKVLPSTTLYYKACTKHFPVLLCTTKLAQSYFPVLLCTTKLAQTTSQYYLYYKACKKHFPVLLCTTKLAQSIPLCTTKLAKVLPSATLYYEACAEHYPVLLCTANLAQSTSQYYFVI